MRRIQIVLFGSLFLIMAMVRPALAQVTCESLFRSDLAEYTYTKRTRLHETYEQLQVAYDRLRAVYHGEYASFQSTKFNSSSEAAARSKVLVSLHERLDAFYMRSAAIEPIARVSEFLYEVLKWRGDEVTPEQVAITMHLLHRLDTLTDQPINVLPLNRIQRVKNIFSVAIGRTERVLAQYEPELVDLNEQMLYLSSWLLYGERPSALIHVVPPR